ncbi:MAG: DUF4097 family beta strand repeat-containing protein [Acidobacteriota bacterium]
MEGKRGKGFLITGLLLVAAGVSFLFIPSGAGHAARWFARLLPLVLISAGVVRVMSYAIERKPRSPIGGMLLIFIGVLWLANRIHPELNGLHIYGRYWLLLLAVFAAVELVRYYSHPEKEGPPPRLFTAGRIVAILLIVATGVVAGRIAGNSPSLLSALRLDGFLGNLRDSFIGQEYSFTDQAVEIAAFNPQSRVAISNSYGDVSVVGGATILRARLSKGVRSWSEDEAKKISDQIQIVVEQTEDGWRITTNRDQIAQQFTTSLQIEIPAAAHLEITNSYGRVSASNIDSPLAVKASYGKASINGITGDVEISLAYSDFDLANVNGNAAISGARRAQVSQVQGALKLSASKGSVTVRDIAEEAEINAPFCNITVQNIQSDASIRTERGSVVVARAGDVTIDAPYSNVQAEEIRGDLNVTSSNSDIRLRSIAGEATVAAQRSAVTADDMRGRVEVETSHGGVTVRNFYSGLRVQTSYRDVTLVSASQPMADIDVENTHGEIRLILPESSQFQIDAESENGRVRPVGFDNIAQPSRHNLLAVFGTAGPRIRLRTSYKSITLQAAGSRQAQNRIGVN